MIVTAGLLMGLLSIGSILIVRSDHKSGARFPVEWRRVSHCGYLYTVRGLGNDVQVGGCAGALFAQNPFRLRARKGDTIAKIAAAHKLSADEVARLNGIAPNVELQAGQEIKLPSAAPAASGSRRR